MKTKRIIATILVLAIALGTFSWVPIEAEALRANSIEDSIPAEQDRFSIPCSQSDEESTRGNGWLWPVDDVYSMSRGYFYYSSSNYHDGLDITCSGVLGRPVRATKSGTVIWSNNTCPHTNYGSDYGSVCNCAMGGNYIKIHHDDGTYSVYYHMLQNSVIPNGTRVNQGDCIGAVGSSGNSTGPHLHFSAYNTSNQIINPNPTDSRHGEYEHQGTGISYFYSSQPAVYFAANGGTCNVRMKQISFGSPIGELPSASREGYEFAGWYPAQYGGINPVTSNTVLNNSKVLFAHWANRQFSAAGRYPVLFNAGRGIIEPGSDLKHAITGYNMGRGTGALIVYNCGGQRIETNEWGTEIAVNSDGKVIQKRAYGDHNPMTVPEGGFILSGHDAGRDFVESIPLGDYVAYGAEAYHFTSREDFLFGAKYVDYNGTLGDLPEASLPGWYFRGWYGASSDTELANYLTPVPVYAMEGMVLQAVFDSEPTPVNSLEYNGHWYELYDYHMLWDDAKTFCEERGGHLATITDASEQAKMVELIQGGSFCTYFIGCSDAETEGVWKWVTGEPFSYENWDRGANEPNNTVDNSDYGHIMAVKYGLYKEVGEWNDVEPIKYGFYGYMNGGFICEYEEMHQHNFVAVQSVEPDCTNEGNIEYWYCDLCGMCFSDPDGENEITLESTVIPPLGHDFADEIIDATCVQPAGVRHTCTRCSYSFTDYSDVNFTEWSVDYPDGADENLIESRTEYRFRDRQTTESLDPELSGWTQYDHQLTYSSWSEWQDAAISPDDTTEVESRTVYAYYYFQCPSCGAHMHVWNVTCPTGMGGCGQAYIPQSSWHIHWSTTPHDQAGFAAWYDTGKQYAYVDGELVFKWQDGMDRGEAVKTQYRSRSIMDMYYYWQWGDWSDWSADPTEATDTREVETRTVYRYVTSGLGEHVWDDGVVTTEPTDTENGVMTYTCSVCGATHTEPIPHPVWHTVTFMDWDGTVLKTETVEHGHAAAPPADPEREGYTFIGWDADLSSVADDLTVTAQYQINTYTVIFLDWDGSLIMAESVEHGHAATPPPAPTREGYTFIGWDADLSSITDYLTVCALYEEIIYDASVYTAASFSNPIGGGLTYYAYVEYRNRASASAEVRVVWTTVLSGNSYTVYGQGLDVTTNSGSASVTVLDYGVWSSGTAVQRTAQCATDWLPVSFGSPNDFSTVISIHYYQFNRGGMDMTAQGVPGVNATWSVNIPLRHTVAFYDWDGTVLKTELVAHGHEATPPADPAREGYSFIGWDADFTNVTSDLTVTAQYELISDPDPTPPPVIDPSLPTVSVGTANGIPGHEVSVDLRIDGEYSASGLTLSVGYDPELLTLVSVTQGDIWTHITGRGGTVMTNTNEPGSVGFISIMPTNSETTSGVLFTLTFAVSDSAEIGTELDLALAVAEFYSMPSGMSVTPIAHNSVGGRIIVNFTPGDVDGDGVLTSVDALIAMRGAIQLIQLTPDQALLADINGDGWVTSIDALIIMRKVLGLI